MRESFVLYTAYSDQLDLLSDEQCGKLFRAIMTHAKGEDVHHLDSVTMMLFSVIRARMDTDAERYAAVCKARSEAGKKGGRPRAANQDKAKKAKGFFDNQDKAKKAKKADYEYEYDIDNDNDKNIKPLKPSLSAERFEAFWKAYPKKVGKKAAASAWEKARVSGELFTKIMTTLEAVKCSDQWHKEGGRYIPNPATWINQGRWDDDVQSYTQGVQGTKFSNFDQRNDDLDDLAAEEMRRKLCAL